MEPEAAVSETLETRCCIAGGGPAGMMLGFLLARAGVDVVVLEKHADFLRDFRGDTIHPSTLELMYELGLLEEFLQRPHQQVSQIGAEIEGFAVTIGDFTHLPTHAKFVALMPQWDFLNFIAEKAKQYPHFHLRMESEVTNLLKENGRVRGVLATTPHGILKVHADVTVGADGRHSTVRKNAGLEVMDLGAPIDVLVVSGVAAARRPEPDPGAFPRGKDSGDAGSRRVLAVRLCDPQGRVRGPSAKEAWRPSSKTSRTSRRFWLHAWMKSLTGIRSSC